jgi:hypothetical protein
MKVADEDLADVDSAISALDEPMVSAGPVVHHDKATAYLEKIARTLPIK